MNYLKSLWQGRVPLVHTYWIVYFLVALPLLYLPRRLLEFQANEGGESAAATGVTAIGAVFTPITAAYLVFASVAVWRSAGAYERNAGWAAAAKGAVILGALKFVGELALPA